MNLFTCHLRFQHFKAVFGERRVSRTFKGCILCCMHTALLLLRLYDARSSVSLSFIWCEFRPGCNCDLHEARFFYQRAQSILEVMAKASWVYINLGSSKKQANLNRIKGQREKTPSSLQRRSTWSTPFRNQRNG